MRRRPGVIGSLVIAALAGFGGVVATWRLFGQERFWANWILWFLFLLTVGLGAFFIVALEHVVGARWSVPLRRIPERLSSLILIMGPVALAGLFSLPHLYPWTDPEVLKDPLVGGKAGWLNIPFFSGRVAICAVLWSASYWILVRGSLQQDKERNADFNLRARRIAPVIMIVFGITITLAAFDWISSLEPTWYSDIFGVYFFAGAFLAGLAATTLAILYLQRCGRLTKIRPDHLYNLGGFLFAFTVFWSYIGFAQYLLMWYADIPEEVFWYQERLHGGWGALLIGLAVLHFLVPFFILIPRGAKSSPRFLIWTSAVILVAHWIDLYWMIVPVLKKGVLFGLPEISFALLFISAALLWVRYSMKHGEDMPVGDPMLREGLEFRL